MYIINNVVIDERIPFIKFSCKLEECNGSCCTISGGNGAPILNEEVKEIQNALHVVKKYLPPTHQKQIEEDGGVDSPIAAGRNAVQTAIENMS